MTRLATQTTAVVIGIAVLVMLLAGIPLGVLDRQSSVQFFATYYAIGLSFLGVGVLVAYRRPELPMGWILLTVGALTAMSDLGVFYSVLDYRRHHGHLPLGAIAVLIEPLWAPAFMLLALAIFLYPNGTLPSRRWRWPLRWMVAVTSALAVVTWGLIAHVLSNGNVRIESGGDLYQVDHPTGAWQIIRPLESLVFGTLVLTVIAWLIGQLVGYRRLGGDARLQQKWIISGAAISFLAVISNVLPYPFSTTGNGATISDFVSWALAALPVAMGVGILRYHLYEIDRIVSRTLSYAILTALLVGAFVGLVALTTHVLPFSSSVGVAASTLAAAALFNPLRVWVQRVVDRRFNRARYDAEATVNAFAAALRDAVDLDTVQAELIATVERAVEPTHATIWLRSGGRS
jgi:hypothetical protein